MADVVRLRVARRAYVRMCIGEVLIVLVGGACACIRGIRGRAKKTSILCGVWVTREVRVRVLVS